MDGEVLEAPTLSPGVLLAEHPAVSGPGRALVLVYDISKNLREVHGDEDWVVRGYVVNRPFPRTVEEVTAGAGGKGAIPGPFGKLALFHGGMAGDGRLSVLHRHAGIEGAAPINEDAGCPLYVGGRADAIADAIANGRAQPSDFKVITGAWESRLAVGGTTKNPQTGQEEPDLDWPEGPLWLMATGEGAWQLAMLPPLFDRQGKFADGKGLGVDDNVEGYNFARFWHQNAAWSHAVRGIGRSAAAEAEAAGDPDAARKAREVESWADLHAATVAYARALAPQSPASYQQLWAEQERRLSPGAAPAGEAK